MQQPRHNVTGNRRALILFSLAFALQAHAQRSITAARVAAGSATSHAALADTEPTASVTLEAALHDLFARADVVFTGEVTSVERTPGAVLVHWQVEDAVRGVTAGSVYTLRKWPGLDSAHDVRYTAGQRALLLLHAPSIAGYGSPVGGGDGVIALHGEGVSSVLDLRLLAQRVLVTDPARLRPALAVQAAGGSLALSDRLQRDAAVLRSAEGQGAAQVLAIRPGTSRRLERSGDSDDAPTFPAEKPASTTANTNSSVDGALVLGMLHAWQREAAARQ